MSFADLPNRFDYAEAQDRIFKFWEEGGYFEADPDPTRESYCVVIPPPNVTGALHLGHALNNTLQDVLVRLKRMQGFNALWMPGTDHAGIATQAVVEKRLKQEEGKSRHDLGRQELVRRIWLWKDQYEARILGQLQRLGCSCDWRRTRFTLDPVCAAAVRRAFWDLFHKGLIYRGKRLVNWDTFLQTAVSDDEVFFETVQGAFWHFRYPVIDPRPGEPTHVVVATTRPETMLGDTAVAVHPDPASALRKAEEELTARLAAAAASEKADLERRVADIQRRRQTMLPALEQLRDMARAGRKVCLPLLDREIPLVADAWAKPELGSGCVKITPAHDPNDYLVGARCHLPMINILNPDGALNEFAGPYQGMPIPQARKRVVADLEARGLVEQVEERDIEVPHSDRSKTPIEPFLADQWFVRMDQLAQHAIDAVNDGRVQIFPRRYAKSYLDWLGEKRDWPVSRQLWWGHQIPVWSKPVPAEKEREELAALLDAWRAERPELLSWRLALPEDDPGHLLLGAKRLPMLHACLASDEAEAIARLERLGFERSDEVLDTWFSSALWPHSTLGWPEPTAELNCFYPTSALVTSRDIITLWVARMVLMSLNNVGDVPFREVFIHPKILDAHGETMSKSKGNGIDPLDVIAKFGPDALRFAMAHLTTETQDARMPVQYECPHCQALLEQTKQNRELPRLDCKKCGQPFSTQWASKPADAALPRGLVVSERFEQARNFVSKLWNAARFSLINLEGYAPGAIARDELTLEDRWILSRLATVTRQATEAFETYHFAEGAKALYDFAWDEFCSLFLETLKPRLQDETTRHHCQRVLAYTLDTLLRLLHPLTPFITEEVWGLLRQAAPLRGLNDPVESPESIMIAPWPSVDEERVDLAIEARFAKFQAALGALREIRSRQNIPPKQMIEFSVVCDPETAALLQPMEPYFARMAGAKATAWATMLTPPAACAKATLPGMEILVDLAGLIDVKAEIAKGEKESERLTKLIEAKEKRLATPSFVDRAPEQVVRQERDSLADARRQLASIQASLEKLRTQR